MISKNPKLHYRNFSFSECKDDLTCLFTSKPIAVVALSTAPAGRLRAPSVGAPTLGPLAPHPPAPQQLPISCQAGSSWEPSKSCQLPGLARRNAIFSFSDKIFWQLWRAVLRPRKSMVSRCKQSLWSKQRKRRTDQIWQINGERINLDRRLNQKIYKILSKELTQFF